MQFTSPAFEHEGTISPTYTCDGENISPPLAIADVPSDAKSLALVIDDPDAVKPAGKVWDHLVVWNIPRTTVEIPEGQEPPGIVGQGTSKRGYQGPCPPDGEHRYYFKLYALDTMLDLPASSSKAELERSMEGHVLAEAVLMGRYTRSF
jgi:hypothetical protein